MRIDKKDEKGVSPFSAHNPHLFVEVIRFSVIRGESMRGHIRKLCIGGSAKQKWEEAKKKGLNQPLFDWFESSCSSAPRQAPYLEVHSGQNPYRNPQSGPRGEAHLHGFRAASSRAGAHRPRHSSPIRERALPSQAPEGTYERTSRLRGIAANIP